MTRDPLPWRPLRSGKISEEVGAVTFDEWWAGHPHEARYLTHAGLAKRCWEAAIATQQTEHDRIEKELFKTYDELAEKEAENQRLLNRLAGGMRLAHKAQLARFEKELEAANSEIRAYQAEIERLTKDRDLAAGRYQAMAAGWTDSQARLADARAENERLTYELGEWRQPNMLTEVESRERIAKATARYEAVVEAAREVLIVRRAQMGVFPTPPIDKLRAALAAL